MRSSKRLPATVDQQVLDLYSRDGVRTGLTPGHLVQARPSWNMPVVLVKAEPVLPAPVEKPTDQTSNENKPAAAPTAATAPLPNAAAAPPQRAPTATAVTEALG